MGDTPILSELAMARRPVAATLKILLNWSLILAVFLVVADHRSWPYLLVGFILIGIEQHALGLWMHEGIHWLIARDKTVNDLVVIALLSGPLVVPLNAFRQRHFAHHRLLGTPQDTKPVIFTRVDGKQFWYFLLMNCFGLQFLSILRVYLSGDTSVQKSVEVDTRQRVLDAAGIVLAQGTLFLLVSAIGPWSLYLWLWVLPWLTINRFIAGLRSVIEHQPLPPDRHPFTRNLQPSLLDRMLFCRTGFQYHWTHHRHPNIPCFNLPRVDIQGEEPAAKRGYMETLSLLVRSAPAAAEQGGGVHVG